MMMFRVNHEPLSLQGRPHGGGTPEAAAYAVGIVRYIGREREIQGGDPCGEFLSGVDGASSMREVAQWIRDEVLYNERVNGRIGERLICSLPREFSREQRVGVVERFAASVTEGGRIPWFAGIHDVGKDAKNPHVHVVFRDRMTVFERAARKAAGERVVKGQSVLGWLNKMATKDALGSTERFRSAWAEAINGAYAEAGIFSQVDHRSAARRHWGDDTASRRLPIEERAKRELLDRKMKDRSILEHATARLTAAEQAGRITPRERMDKLMQIEERLRTQTSAAQARWDAAIYKRYFPKD